MGLINRRMNVKHLWAYIYLFVVIFLSYLNINYNIIIFMLFFLMAIPFFKKPEYYLGITLLLNTIAYYFIGADEGIFSYTTILLVVYLGNIFIYKNGCVRINFKCIFSLICIAIITIISYKYSIFHYTNGMLRLLYLITITSLLGSMIKIDIKFLGKILPNLAIVMTIGYLITVLLTKSFIDGRLTIANAVNTNTFGMSCAQLATIVSISFLGSKRKSLYKLIFALIIVALAFFSGSRGALLAFLASVGIVLLIKAKRTKKIGGYLLKLAIIGIVIMVIVAIVGPIVDIDISRFNISEAFSKGGSGTTRLLIITTLFPLIIRNKYYIWGYGPGHECSRRLIQKNIIFNFAHTHNTFFESFGELGIGGLFFTVVCTIRSLTNIFRYSKIVENAYIILGMFICLLINGMAESYFCDGFFWLMLMITRNQYNVKSLVNEYEKKEKN